MLADRSIQPADAAALALVAWTKDYAALSAESEQGLLSLAGAEPAPRRLLKQPLEYVLVAFTRRQPAVRGGV